ncbi:ribonuclease [Undibacterium terreum]|uniref:Ribonuclease n=1 Tax=Undibacterium terreum TaxID=1224302 RepID=A0A916UGW3_9BURK|nr:ribonuclease [Undibacterium terreum]GGC73273.1 ribonuclease [Undibacterium terreum]
MTLNATILKKWTAFLAMLVLSVSVFAREAPLTGSVSIADLPPEARTTLMLIKQGGPFAYDKDGVVFGNYEARLPKQKRGYYHEYTVKTPRARNRGVRRIIAGGEPRTSGEYYYTDDHYESFRKIRE